MYAAYVFLVRALDAAGRPRAARRAVEDAGDFVRFDLRPLRRGQGRHEAALAQRARPVPADQRGTALRAARTSP
jgi:hypothetical protein